MKEQRCARRNSTSNIRPRPPQPPPLQTRFGACPAPFISRALRSGAHPDLSHARPSRPRCQRIHLPSNYTHAPARLHAIRDRPSDSPLTLLPAPDIAGPDGRFCLLLLTRNILLPPTLQSRSCAACPLHILLSHKRPPGPSDAHDGKRRKQARRGRFSLPTGPGPM